jgi:hypothetical protein
MVTDSEQEITGEPKQGDYAKDTKRNRSGVVLIRTDRYVHLRSIAGGEQWDAKPSDVRKLTSREELSARLAWRNAAHRWGK